jgi:hypothetical protein
MATMGAGEFWHIVETTQSCFYTIRSRLPVAIYWTTFVSLNRLRPEIEMERLAFYTKASCPALSISIVFASF